MRFETSIDLALALRTLANAPLLAERGLLVGVITATSGSDLEAPGKWVSGETPQSLIALLERTPADAATPAAR